MLSIKNGSVCNRSDSWKKNPAFLWDLPGSGLYSIQGHIKRDGVNTISFSAPILFLEGKDEAAFSDYEGAAIPSLPNLGEDVFRPSYPYNDFLLIDGPDVNSLYEQCHAFSKRHALKIKAVEGSVGTLLIADQIDGTSEFPYAFSGSCFSDGRLVYGSRDVESINSIIREEPVGNYNWVSKSDSGFSCGTDYFGVSKIYYIQGDGVALIGNSYHLLLLLARDVGIPLNIDREKASSILVFANIQIFHQNYTHRMDVNPVMMLPADKVASISGGVIKLSDSSLANALSSPSDYDPAAYRDLLDKAKGEILDNVKSVLDHAAFEHVIVDLSGGLDSRLVFCALTNFPEYKIKIRINSLYSAAGPDDLIVAQEVASLYDYEFDDLERIVSPMPGKNMAGSYWSHNLGVYYSYTPPYVSAYIPGTARLTGAYGEVCARPYYARGLFGTEMDVLDTDDFVDLYLLKHKKTSVNSDIYGLNALKNLLRRTGKYSGENGIRKV